MHTHFKSRSLHVNVVKIMRNHSCDLLVNLLQIEVLLIAHHEKFSTVRLQAHHPSVVVSTNVNLTRITAAAPFCEIFVHFAQKHHTVASN